MKTGKRWPDYASSRPHYSSTSDILLYVYFAFLRLHQNNCDTNRGFTRNPHLSEFSSPSKSEKNRDPVLPTLTLIDQPILPCRPHSISQGSDPWRRVTGQRIGIRTFTLNPEGRQLQEALGTIYNPEIRRLRFRPRQAAIRLEPRASFVLPSFLKLG